MITFSGSLFSKAFNLPFNSVYCLAKYSIANFRLLNEFDVLMDAVINNNGENTAWHLTLELTPIDDL